MTVKITWLWKYLAIFFSLSVNWLVNSCFQIKVFMLIWNISWQRFFNGCLTQFILYQTSEIKICNLKNFLLSFPLSKNVLFCVLWMSHKFDLCTGGKPNLKFQEYSVMTTYLRSQVGHTQYWHSAVQEWSEACSSPVWQGKWREKQCECESK